MLDKLRRREAERCLKLIRDINPTAYEVLSTSLRFYDREELWATIHSELGDYATQHRNETTDVIDVVVDIDEMITRLAQGGKLDERC